MYLSVAGVVTKHTWSRLRDDHRVQHPILDVGGRQDMGLWPQSAGVVDRVDRRLSGATPYGPATQSDDVITITRTGRVRRM